MASGGRKNVGTAVFVALGVVVAGPARAEPLPPSGLRPSLEAAVGVSGVFDDGTQPMRYDAELLWRPLGRWSLTPGLGVTYADGGASFVYLDLRRDFWIDPRWAVSLSLGAGLFHEDGGLDLGSEVEFRSGIGLARRCGDRWRIGIAFYHLSNGGLSDRNPGTEAVDLRVNYSLGKPPGG